MRFSSIFQLPLPRVAAIAPVQVLVPVPVPVPAPAPVEEAALPTAPAGDTPGLPEALDERVRLIGEWQLGES